MSALDDLEAAKAEFLERADALDGLTAETDALSRRIRTANAQFNRARNAYLEAVERFMPGAAESLRAQFPLKPQDVRLTEQS